MLMAARISVFVSVLPLLAAQAARWPEFRGPRGDGHAPEARVPLRWSEAENVRWKPPVPGRAWSSPVVWGGKVWVTTAAEKGEHMGVMALDLRTGAVLHQRRLLENEEPAPRNALNSYASPSPVIEEGRVYLHFGSYGTFCLDTGTGETVWARRDLPCDHKEGPGSSPFLFEDLLILHMDGIDVQYVVALEKGSGETRWKTARTFDLSAMDTDMHKAYTTPIVVTLDGEPRLVSTAAEGTFVYDPRTGKELWRLRHKGFSQSSRPVFGGGLVYLNTGYVRPRLLAVRLEGAGHVKTEDVVAWTHTRSGPTMPSPLLVGPDLYIVSNGGVVSCLDAKTGATAWRERVGGEHSASPVFVDGRLYFFDRQGGTAVIAPGRVFKKLAANRLDDGFMASPAVVDDGFVLRTKTHLYRIGARGEDR